MNHHHLLLPLALTLAFTAAAAPTQIDQWLFESSRIQGNTLKAAQGPHQATLENTQLDEATRSVLLNGRNSTLLITSDLHPTNLPTQPFTVEAWVAINRPQPWGGIIGCIQDNGSHERGWLLGFIGSQFSFALATTGAPAMTYAKGTTSFTKGQWYHVAGTYDGTHQRLYVNGRQETSSTTQSGPINHPTNGTCVIGSYHDDDERYFTDGRIHEIGIFNSILTGEEIQSRYLAKKDFFPGAPSRSPIGLGPFAEWIAPDTIEISWETLEPMPSLLHFGLKSTPLQRMEHPEPKRLHSFTIGQIRRDHLYAYQIRQPRPGLPDRLSDIYEFDSTFYYLPHPAPDLPSPYPADELTEIYAATATRILKESRLARGYCLVLGAGEGRLAYHIARQSELNVIAVEEDPSLVARARRSLDQAGLYGTRVTVHQSSLTNLPYGPYFANLIVSDNLLHTGQLPASAEDVIHFLQPAGGIAWLGQPAPLRQPGLTSATLQDWLKAGNVPEATLTENDGLWAVIKRPPLAGAGSWSHQYGGTDNAACSQDALVSGELQVLWWGEPGPRPMPDRGNRNPAPLSVHGHLFVQGNRILFGIDSYNGTILWSKSVPEARRANMPRDCSNMAASPDHLYVAQGRFCYAIQARSGLRDLHFITPDSPRNHDWGYLAVNNDLLLGSAVLPAEAYLGDDGEWYEDYHADQVAKVTSEQFFAFNRHTGERQWLYRNGAIINSTITIGDNVVYFVESRNPAATDGTRARRMDEITKDQYVVALDIHTGRLLWERAHDFSQCQFTLYLSYATNTLVAMGTDQDKNYHLYALDVRPLPPPAPDQSPSVHTPGTLLWEQHFKAARDHHSGHLQRPVIVNETIYTDQRAFELKSGALLRSDLPERRGCGTMSASLGSLFYRHHFHGMWDLKTDQRIQFEGIRSGCWLSLITAGGLLLAPETSSGCSCTHAIQTSVAYIPTASTRPNKH